MTKYKCERKVVEHLTLDEMYSLLSAENPGPIKFWARWIGDLSLEYRDKMQYVGITHKEVIQNMKDSMNGKTVDLSGIKNDIVSLENVVLLRGREMWCPVTSAKELKEYLKTCVAWHKFRCKGEEHMVP